MPPSDRPHQVQPLRLRAVVGVLAAVAMLVAGCSPSGDADPTPRALTARPVEPSPPFPAASTPGSPTPSPSRSPSPDPSPEQTDREPTATDRARFVATYRPETARDLEHVAIDVDGDGVSELVFAYVSSTDGHAHVDVAWWLGNRYEVRFRGDGGPAERVERLRIVDVNGDGMIEVTVTHGSGSSGQSISLWRARPPGSFTLEPLVGREGCAAGRNTYGVVGARMEDQDGDGREEIYATCDDSPLPVAVWSTDVYVWRDGAYRFERTEGPGG